MSYSSSNYYIDFLYLQGIYREKVGGVPETQSAHRGDESTSVKHASGLNPVPLEGILWLGHERVSK